MKDQPDPIKRRDFVKTTTLAAVSGTLGISAACSTTPPQATPPSKVTDPLLIESLDAVFGEHMDAELAGDLDGTMATMTAEPHIVNVASMIGGKGQAGVRQFYANRLIGQFFPPDVKFETVSSTHSPERLVSELIISFTHTIEMDHILPGVKPTGKFAEVVFVVIVGFDNGKVSYEHIHWDQANLLVQLGLIDPKGLPLTGAGAAAKLRDPSIPDPFFNEA
jgi:carboxymethylenebutenolidase